MQELGIGYHVIIQAQSASKANYKAIKLNLYFDGGKSGIDCRCCGDRWVRVGEESGRNYPHILGENAFVAISRVKERDLIFVHPASGSFYKIHPPGRTLKMISKVLNHPLTQGLENE